MHPTRGSVLFPDSFATGMGLVADRTVESCSISVAFGQSSFTDLDFVDDVSLLAELLELLVPILETIASEVALNVDRRACSDSRHVMAPYKLSFIIIIIIIPRVRGELAEDKGTSFGLQGGYAINHQGSGP